MQREHRANLWFLTVFLILSLPGAVILFHRKLDPRASRMDQPDALTTRWAYVVPPPAPPEVRWVVPPETWRWLASVARARGFDAGPLTPDPDGHYPQPLISSDHRLQAIGLSQAPPARTTVGLVLWNAGVGDDARRFVARAHGSGTSGSGTSAHADAEFVAVPAEVRRELMDLGFIHPPARIVLVSAAFEPPLASGPARIDVAYGSPGNPSEADVQITIPPALRAPIAP